MSLRYPFSAIAGQDELKEALLLTAVDPLINNGIHVAFLRDSPAATFEKFT